MIVARAEVFTVRHELTVPGTSTYIRTVNERVCEKVVASEGRNSINPKQTTEGVGRVDTTWFPTANFRFPRGRLKILFSCSLCSSLRLIREDGQWHLSQNLCPFRGRGAYG
jgi:hypothetical protein